jgi:hypothetical protein
MNEKRAVSEAVAKRHQRARKKEKSKMLDEFYLRLPDILAATALTC